MSKKTYKLYTVTDDYINHLRSIETKVRMNHHYGKKRPYLGVIISVDKIEYLVPLTSKNEKYTKNAVQHHRIIINNQKYGVLLFNNMIPVTESVISRIDIENEPDNNYKNLLNKQNNFIRAHIDQLEKKANKLLKIYKKIPFLVELCNDFEKLEKHMLQYE